MLVKDHMLAKEKLTTVFLGETIEDALKKMAHGNFLSLPVLNDKGDLSGLIMKENIYRGYVEEGYKNFQDFITGKYVSDIYTNKIHIIYELEEIENASHLLSELKIPFLAVLNNEDKFVGILTHSAIFNTFSEYLGINKGASKIVIEMEDIPGELAKLTKLVTDENINIVNIAMIDSSLKNKVKIILKLDTKDISNLTKKIEVAGFSIS